MCIIIKYTLFIADDDVTKKIKNIRTQYTCERQKAAVKKSGSGLDDVYISKWPHFNKLRFLDEFVVAKKSTTNLQASKFCMGMECLFCDIVQIILFCQ